jgi:hypothetical protein
MAPDQEDTLPKGEVIETGKHYQNIRIKSTARLWEIVFKEPGRILMYFVDLYTIMLRNNNHECSLGAQKS